MKPATGGEATSKQPSGLPGWLGTARRDRSVEDPGRPGRAGNAVGPNGPRKSITEGRPCPGVGEAHSSEEAGNDRGAKGPYWKHCCCKRKGEPLGRKSDYGKMGAYRSPEGTGERRRTPRQTLFAETEAESKGQAGAEVRVLRIVRPGLSARCAGSGMETGASQPGRARGGWREDRTDRSVGSRGEGIP